MTVTEPGGPVMEGARSLEVRWILPGQLDMAVAGWFDRSQLEVESREDDYLLDPDMGGLSVKVRAGRALEVKVFRGSAGILDCPGRARGRMQYWQKWSFPFRPLSQDSSAPDGWRPVRKQRRINRYSLTGTRITTRPRELADEAWCAVELTELRAHHQDWWSLGFEATGPGDLLRTGLEATAALVFTQALPDGAELRMENSASYAEWLRARPHPQSSTAGDDGGGPGSEPENSLLGKMSIMPLHERETVNEQLADCVFVGRDMTRPVPKYRFPRNETLPREAFQVVSDELILDGNARQNLATFCQTWAEPELLALMALSVEKNMIDKDEYPQTAEIERRCVHMLADLWHAPDGANTVGASAIGSSEACMLAGMAAKWRWRARRRAAGQPTDKPNMVCGPVQVVWHKFARYWDIEMREVPMSHTRYGMDPASMLERVDENTIMVVPTLGVTYTGSYEPVEAMSRALDQLQADTGLDIDIHVDGASGAFLAPFCAPDLLFDFRLPRVKSISASGHKFGLAPLGVGWVVWRDRRELPDDLVFHVNYLGGDMPVFQINFSRPAGQIIAQYYNFLRLGYEGYKRVHQASYEIGQYLAAEIVKLGPFELLCDSDPATGIPTVTWRIREGENPGYTLFDLADRLRARGWQVPAYTLTGTAADIPVQRILVRLGVSHDIASLLLDDFRSALAHFSRHPITVPISREESRTFNHL